MKTGKIYIIIVVMKIVSTYILLEAQDNGIDESYCIIQGENVSIRQNPSIKSKVIGRLDKYEFVYCTGRTENKDKIGEDEDYWYKIRNCDTKEGWVFGKYVRYIDGKNEIDNQYKKIIEDQIIEHGYYSVGHKIKIYKLTLENNHFIIDYESEEKVKMGSEYNIMGVSLLIFYRIINNDIYKTIENMGKRKYIFYKNYILIYSKKGIDVYNTKKFVETVKELHSNIPCKYYEGTGFYLRQDVISNIPECNINWDTRLNCISYSDMEFNTETMEVVVNIRKEKDKLLKQEKYKFKEGKFVRIE